MKIIADTHCHTIASDHAYSTVLENIAHAEKQGLKCIAITDHAPSVTDGPHFWHFANLGAIPRIVHGLLVLRGVEADILNDSGEIDMDERDLRGLDWVNASMHGSVLTPRDEAYHTRAYLKLAQNPNVDVIAHSGTECYRYDYEAGIKVFKEYEKLVEFNNHYIGQSAGSRKNYTEIARYCKKYEVPVVISSDAHFALSVGEADNAVELLEEIGFPERLVLNADEERFFGYIKEKKNIDYYGLIKQI